MSSLPVSYGRTTPGVEEHRLIRHGLSEDKACAQVMKYGQGTYQGLSILRIV